MRERSRAVRARSVLTVLTLGALAAGAITSCGARSGLKAHDYGAALDGSAIEGCLGDRDCGKLDKCAPSRCVAGQCVALPPVECDDGDPCTEDRCVPSTGTCENTHLTLDEDGDGHRGPRPGFLPGSPGACGDDCDDTSALAFPGGHETCDGVDNDCNGIVDDGASYRAPPSSVPLLVSVGADQAGVGGLAFGGASFGVTFAAKNGAWANRYSAFDVSGAVTATSTAITHESTDAFTGPIAWTGKVFGAVWEDRRDKDFEIYFNRLDTKGQKLAQDLRVTNAPNFSLRPDLSWDGTEFVVVWADRREGDADGRIFGQRIGVNGVLVGENVPLSDEGTDADNPHIAKGATELGIVLNEVGTNGRQLTFRTISSDLTVLGRSVVLGGSGAASSAIAWSRDRYVVVWDTASAVPGPTIHGAAIAADGTVLVSDHAVTAQAPFARSEALLPLGDRLLLAWSEYAGGSYSIYAKMIGPELLELSPPSRITQGGSDSLNPILAIGPSGAVAVAFEGQTTGLFQVYATRLECVARP
ncbi:MAG TPA: putative metal-binding motif-containing protein [Polyangiaceae bacterium]